MLENTSAHGRLDSWKEIANYLKRDIRTAYRWEEKGMPVHRVPGSKRQAVFAYKDEIDAWLVSQDDFPDDDFVRSSQGSEDVADLPAPRAVPVLPAKRRTALIFGASVIVLAGIVSVLLVRSHVSPSVRAFSLKKLTQDGRAKGQIRTDGITLYFNEAEGQRSILVSAPMSGSSIQPIETPFSNVFLQDLSNDGKTVLITSYVGITIEGPLWTVPAQGGTPSRVGNAECGLARWSPDNRLIACTHKTAITLMDADGSNARTIQVFSMPVSKLVWTPDGTRLRYALQDITSHTFSQWEIEVGQSRATGQPQRLFLGMDCARTGPGLETVISRGTSTVTPGGSLA